MKLLTESQLKFQAPSIFSEEAHEKTSSKYKLIPTIESVKGLQEAGFYPVKATESRCRTIENKPFVKHEIRFRKPGILYGVGDYLPEIILTNSHDGKSSYQLRAGVYRLICSNGLTVGNDIFCRKIRHQKNCVEEVIHSAQEIIELVPEIIDKVEEWKGITLDVEARKVYSESAALLKWDQEKIPLPTERLLSPRREADKSPDLWTTFNAVQENLVRGGLRYYDSKNHRRGRTREINSVNENSKINIALWNLTEKMAQLAK